MTGNRGGIVLQDRDRHLLRELGTMRVIDREQAKLVGGFTSTTRVNTRLPHLVRAGLLRRFFLGTSGSGQKAVYALSTKGASLVGVRKLGPRRRTNEALTTDFYTLHQLAVNEVYCAVKYEPLPHGVSFIRWVSFYEPLRPNLRLIPDGYFELGVHGEPSCSFLEMDRGTEPLGVWREKVRNYLRYAISDEFEKQFHKRRFRVLVVASSEGRLRSIRKAIAKLTDKIFWLATFEAIEKEGLFNALWLRPQKDQPEFLVRNTQ